MKGGTSSSNRGQQAASKTDKQTPPGKYQVQPTAEQVRYAQLLNHDDPVWVQERIQQVVELTKKPQDEVAIALHDCNYVTETAVVSLLEGQYDQGEWTTFSTKKKKSQSGDGISPNPAKVKPGNGNSRMERKDSREHERSQSVEYNNRKNKGQPDRTADIDDISNQNGPLKTTKPPGAGRNRNQDDRDNRGDRRERRDQSGRDDQGDRGFRGDRSNRGDRTEHGDQGDRNNRFDRPNRGDRGGDRGYRGERGERGDRGDRGEYGDRGNQGERDRRSGGRGGGFGRRGGMGRGGRGGGRSSRGGRFGNNSNRSFGRKSDQTNGPSKDTEFGKSENWENTPARDENDWATTPLGTTEDWGADVETTNSAPLDSLSWETPEKEEKDTNSWKTDEPSQQSNYINHLPECDDEAILSSKVASTSLINTPLPSFATPSSLSSQPHETANSFSLSSEGQIKDDNLNTRAQNNRDHPLSSLSDVTRSDQTTTNKIVPSTMTSVTGSVSDQRQPQRQLKPRTRRTQKSQIPKQPVEMPGNNGGMDSVDVQFGNLEFGDESIATSKTQQEPQPPASTTAYLPSPTTGSLTLSQSVPTPAVITTVSPIAVMTKPVTMTTAPPAESSVVNTYEQMTSRHYQLPGGTSVTNPSVTKLTPDSSPRKDTPELKEPRTPPMTKKVDVSTSPLPLTSTITMAKSNNDETVSRGTMLRSQIQAMAASESLLDERIHQQAPPMGHSSSPRSDQNTIRSRLPVNVSASSTSHPTPTGVTLSTVSAGPPPGIIHGIQTNVSALNTNGAAKTSNINRQQAHSASKPPNLPPGVLPVYSMPHAPGFPGFSPLAFPVDDIQMMPRMPMPPYYDMTFPLAAGRDGVQTTYSGADVKYNRNDNSSPVPASLTAGPHAQQAPFMNTHAQIHPFGYGNLAFYHGAGMIGGFPAPYTTQMYQVPTKGPGVTTQFQHNFGNQLGPHYTSGYDGLANAHDFGKQGYQHQAQNKTNAVSGTTVTNTGSDLTNAYNKPQFDKGYLSGTPPPLNLPLSGQGHQPHHPAGFPIVMAPAQHPPSLFPSHHLSHQQLDSLNPNRGAQSQGKVPPTKSHGQSMYQNSPFWSGTN